MNEDESVDQLERTLEERSEALAEEQISNARQQRERILHEQHEHLRLREESETLSARAEAERHRRSRVQACRLEQQTELERRRWEVIEDVLEHARDRLRVLSEDEDRYAPVMAMLVKRAVERIPEGVPVAVLNARDRETYADRWDRLLGDAVPGRQVRLDESTHSGIGGVIVHDEKSEVRVDNTFDGRLERHADDLRLLIDDALFGEED